MVRGCVRGTLGEAVAETKGRGWVAGVRTAQAQMRGEVRGGVRSAGAPFWSAHSRKRGRFCSAREAPSTCGTKNRSLSVSAGP